MATMTVRTAAAALAVVFVVLAATALLNSAFGTTFAELDAMARERAVSAGEATSGSWRAVTRVGASYVLWPCVAIAWLVLQSAGRRDAARLLAEIMLGALAIEQAIKLIVQRARPSPLWGDVAPSSYSYPSGHALLTTCFLLGSAWILGRHSTRSARTALWGVAIALALAVGASRVALGVHYFTDVVAGHAIAVVWLAALRLARRRTALRPPGTA
jgi:membrane-associated phospholipid phosphatase